MLLTFRNVPFQQFTDQALIIYPLLKSFGITSKNLGHFVLDNAKNNDTTLEELGRRMGFDSEEKRLRCMGHVINLVAEQYLFGQDAKSFDDNYKTAGPGERRQLWRQRGEVGKLHNLVYHILGSGKRTDLFGALQQIENMGVAAGKTWRLVVDGGIRWNSTYAMIRRALELRSALDSYCRKLRVGDEVDQEIAKEDYISSDEWATLEIIKEQLEPLFRTTKALEGNARMQEGASKPSGGALWEVLPAFEHILSHFEQLQNRSATGEFNDNLRIQSSITHAWNKATEYYQRTDKSIAWQAAVVLHPRWKWAYFEKNWTGDARRYVREGKATLRQFWEDDYKSTDRERSGSQAESTSSELEGGMEIDYLESVLNQVAPPSTQVRKPTSRKDQLQCYVDEGAVDYIPVMQYWRSREGDWPQLAAMAFDFLAIPAMSAECERVFSSVALQTTTRSSKLSGKTLWHQECLKNWSNRGAITIATAYNGIPLFFGEKD